MSLGSFALGTAPLGGEAPSFRATLAVPSEDSPSSIIRISGLVGNALVRHFHEHPAELSTIGRRKFEELVAELFHGFGYEVELTKQTRDGGKDIIAVRRAEVDVRYLIECKRPDPGKTLGVRPVRELLGVKTSDPASKAILATTAYFSPDARLLLDKHSWELEGRDYDGLLDWLRRYADMRV